MLDNKYFDELDKAFTHFKNDGVLLYPTATVWGLGCSIFSEKAVEKIYTLKNRERNKPLIVLVSTITQLQEIVGELPNKILELAQSDEPTSIAYPEVKNIPNYMLAENGSLAIRVTRHPFCVALINKTNEPLVSTSANIAGQPTPKYYAEISNEIIDNVDFAVSKEIEKSFKLSSQSSRLVLWNKESDDLKVVR